MTINYFQTHRPTINEFQKYFKVNYNLNDWREVLMNAVIKQDFMIYSQTQYVAFNVFPININFLFVFIGSVITFTVMLIQLLNY